MRYGILILFVFFYLLGVQANASELEQNRIPKDSRFLLHVDVQKAIQSQTGKAFERLWINPLLEGYGGNISPSVEWNSTVIGGITFFGKGVYTNFHDQVFIFKPLSTNWLIKLRKELKLKDGIVFNNDYEGDPVAGAVKVPVRDDEVAVSDYIDEIRKE